MFCLFFFGLGASRLFVLNCPGLCVLPNRPGACEIIFESSAIWSGAGDRGTEANAVGKEGWSRSSGRGSQVCLVRSKEKKKKKENKLGQMVQGRIGGRSFDNVTAGLESGQKVRSEEWANHKGGWREKRENEEGRGEGEKGARLKSLRNGWNDEEFS